MQLTDDGVDVLGPLADVEEVLGPQREGQGIVVRAKVEVDLQ